MAKSGSIRIQIPSVETIQTQRRYVRQRTEQLLYITAYRRGWHAYRQAQPYSECVSDGEKDGWIASMEADAALRKVRVRE